MIRAGITIALVLAVYCKAQELDPDLKHLRAVKAKDKVSEAVRRGLKYLVAKQNKKTGAFDEHKLPNTMTALTCLALMSDGVVPGKDRYGKELLSGLRFLVKASKKGKGYYGYEANGRMYAHAICTIALCEAFGMMPTEKENRELGKVLKKALKVIVDAQVKAKGKYQGGWHYHPKATQADLSVTAWQILALKAALNCNLEVPKEVVENAITFVRGFYNAKSETFTYDGNRVTPAMRAAGVVSLMALGAGVDTEDAVKVRNSAGPLLNMNMERGRHYYTQCFYLAACANALGGKYQTKILTDLTKAMLKQQNKDGSFKKMEDSFGGIYATACAVISLNVRRQLLPFLQN